MGYFMLGICAGIIVTGLAFSIMFAKDFAKWEEDEEEMEDDLIDEEYQDLW